PRGGLVVRTLRRALGAPAARRADRPDRARRRRRAGGLRDRAGAPRLRRARGVHGEPRHPALRVPDRTAGGPGPPGGAPASRGAPSTRALPGAALSTTGPRLPASRSPRLPGGAPALTPKLAVRIAAFGAIVAAALAVLLLRLWFLQVIGSDKYQALANDNRLRSVVIDAPRGVITDRDGRVLVDNTPAEDLVFRPREVGPRATARVLARLAPKIGTTPAALRADIRKSERTAPYQAVTLAQHVPYGVQQYVLERRDQLPGIGLQQTWIRRYPRGTTAAHVLGYVGAIPPAEVKAYQRQGVGLDERVGIQGIEAEYQSYLRGVPGHTTVEVDAAGNPVGRQVISSTQPKSGDTLRLSLDLPTQRTLERWIA